MIDNNDNGTFTLTCTSAELSLISEGLYAVEDTGRRCLADDVPDELDRPVLEEELERLTDMCTAVDVTPSRVSRVSDVDMIGLSSLLTVTDAGWPSIKAGCKLISNGNNANRGAIRRRLLAPH